jgi:enterochelin esterase-like enzyme
MRLLIGSALAGLIVFGLSAYLSCRGQNSALRLDRATLLREYRRLSGLLAFETDPARRTRAVDAFARMADSLGAPVTDDVSAIFLYFGHAGRVRVAGEFNRWNPEADTLARVPGTTMFVREVPFPRNARVEYKLIADSVWMLDPLNPRTASGGYGENSDLRMPGYLPDSFAVARAGISRGRIDTLSFSSRLLGRAHPLLVYMPREPGPDPLPVLYVLDGGDYLSFARMHQTLDNLLAGRRLRPLLVVFFDPRTNPPDPATNRRGEDYTLNDRFVLAMAEELVPLIRGRYDVAHTPEQTGILGTSLGGLAATYAVWQRPEVFGVALIQSPSYWWEDEKILGLVRKAPAQGGRFWIETGTFYDARELAPKMRDLLRSQGREVAYAENPQGHNWTHWQSRIPAALQFFAGTPK